MRHTPTPNPDDDVTQPTAAAPTGADAGALAEAATQAKKAAREARWAARSAAFRHSIDAEVEAEKRRLAKTEARSAARVAALEARAAVAAARTPGAWLRRRVGIAAMAVGLLTVATISGGALAQARNHPSQPRAQQPAPRATVDPGEMMLWQSHNLSRLRQLEGMLNDTAKSVNPESDLCGETKHLTDFANNTDPIPVRSLELEWQNVRAIISSRLSTCTAPATPSKLDGDRTWLLDAATQLHALHDAARTWTP